MIEALPIKALTEVPEFSTKDSLGNSFSKKSLLGKKYLLFFYPRDNTPGCTAEACGFRDQQSFFDKKNILIFGISGDSSNSHEKFRQKFDLPFPLLLDLDNKIAKAFGVWGKKTFMGRTFEGIHRTTFLVNDEAFVVKTYSKVKAKSHPIELVEEINTQKLL